MYSKVSTLKPYERIVIWRPTQFKQPVVIEGPIIFFAEDNYEALKHTEDYCKFKKKKKIPEGDVVEFIIRPFENKDTYHQWLGRSGYSGFSGDHTKVNWPGTGK